VGYGNKRGNRRRADRPSVFPWHLVACAAFGNRP